MNNKENEKKSVLKEEVEKLDNEEDSEDTKSLDRLDEILS